ncbi:MAG: hypothetical protein ABI629_01635 [bacterium]
MFEIHSETDRRIGAAMRGERERRGLRVSEVAERAGQSRGDRDARERRPVLGDDQLRGFASAYGLSIVEAFILAGLLTQVDRGDGSGAS